MEQYDDLVSAREILEAFPDLPRHALYRLVELGKVRRYELPPAPWRERTLYRYSLSEVRAALERR